MYRTYVLKYETHVCGVGTYHIYDLKYETHSSFLRNNFKIRTIRKKRASTMLDNDFFPMELSPHEHADLAVGVWQLLCARIIRYRTTAGRTTSRENKITIVPAVGRTTSRSLLSLSLSLSREIEPLSLSREREVAVSWYCQLTFTI